MAEPGACVCGSLAAPGPFHLSVCPWYEDGPRELRPARDPLTKDEVRQLLRECVTVVKPGEILVLQPGADCTPNQLREIQQMTDWWLGENAPKIKVLVVPGGAHQVVRQVPAGPFSPILPVPLDVDPDAPRPEPRRWQYHVGGPCPAPAEDGTCGCPPRAEAPDA